MHDAKPRRATEPDDLDDDDTVEPGPGLDTGSDWDDDTEDLEDAALDDYDRE